jgi:hypothetical protein
VIARPARLTDGPARKNYVKQTGLERVPWSWTISRADVARFLVEAAEVDTWVGKGVQIVDEMPTRRRTASSVLRRLFAEVGGADAMALPIKLFEA